MLLATSQFWNTAIGSDAQYHFANINVSEHVTVDPDWFIYAPADQYEETPWFSPYSWSQRCGPGGTAHGTMQFPKQVIVPDATIVPHSTPNNAGAVLQPDGETIINANPLARCEAGGPVYGYETPALKNQSIYGDGRLGGHGGSGLSSIGGTVRVGELVPGAPPIGHALKWEFWALKYYYLPTDGNASECFQWPAVQCDDAFRSVYGGRDPTLRPGSLLAIPPGHRAAVNATLRTDPGRMLLQALVDYGAYIVSDTAWDCQQFCVEHGVEEEFAAAWGYNMTGTVSEALQAAARGETTGDYVLDVTALSMAMYTVTNSGERSPGGGGMPRQPPPPPIGN